MYTEVIETIDQLFVFYLFSFSFFFFCSRLPVNVSICPVDLSVLRPFRLVANAWLSRSHNGVTGFNKINWKEQISVISRIPLFHPWGMCVQVHIRRLAVIQTFCIFVVQLYVHGLWAPQSTDRIREVCCCVAFLFFIYFFFFFCYFALFFILFMFHKRLRRWHSFFIFFFFFIFVLLFI